MAIDVMMRLGPFPFMINTAAYQDLTRRTDWRWPAQAQIGQRDVYQYTGPGDDAITLDGVVYPQFMGVGPNQINVLRALGDTGKPQRLVSGNGTILGLWLIKSVHERQPRHGRFGAPKKQEFRLELVKYSDTL